jgi:hypothetical protein
MWKPAATLAFFLGGGGGEGGVHTRGFGEIRISMESMFSAFSLCRGGDLPPSRKKGKGGSQRVTGLMRRTNDALRWEKAVASEWADLC